jgi:hypothetical protein
VRLIVLNASKRRGSLLTEREVKASLENYFKVLFFFIIEFTGFKTLLDLGEWSVIEFEVFIALR